MFLIDDSSNLKLIKDDEILTIKEDKLGEFSQLNKINIYSFDNRKGLDWAFNSANNEGWWRSFCASLDIAEEYNYEKIIHIEADAFLISNRLFDYINSLKTGWTALWANKYCFPESCIQIICKDQFKKFRDFASCGSKELSKMGLAEKIIPFTNIERRFLGDRYGENMNTQLKGLDYFCQTKLDTIITAESYNKSQGSNITFMRTLWSFHLFQFFWRNRLLILIIIFLLISFVLI
jgi:hypothetical protein